MLSRIRAHEFGKRGPLPSSIAQLEAARDQGVCTGHSDALVRRLAERSWNHATFLTASSFPAAHQDNRRGAMDDSLQISAAIEEI